MKNKKSRIDEKNKYGGTRRKGTRERKENRRIKRKEAEEKKKIRKSNLDLINLILYAS